MIRLDFPGYSGEDSLEAISWDDWFQKFDESNLALLVQEKTARGQKSNFTFNKLVSRDNVDRQGSGSGGRRSSSSASTRRRKASQTTDTGESAGFNEDVEEIEMEADSRRGGSRTTTSGTRGKRKVRSTAASRSPAGHTGTVARGTSIQRAELRGTSTRGSSARSTTSRAKKPAGRTSGGSSRGLRLVGKTSTAARGHNASSSAGRGRPNSRRRAA